jgi:hypothetical protein
LALASNEDAVCFTKFFEIIARQVGNHPTHVLADGAFSITNAVSAAFLNAVRLMCWAHAVKNVDQKLKPLEPAIKTQIRREIEVLQFATSEAQFHNGNFCLIFTANF